MLRTHAVHSRPLRIAYVYAGNAPVFGRRGASVHVQEVIRAFARRDARVELVARRFGGDPLPGLGDVGRIRLSRPGRRAPRRPPPDPNAEVREALAALGPLDLVYERFSVGSHAAMEHAREIGAGGVLEVNGPRLEKAAARGAIADRSSAEASASRAVDAATAIVTVSEGVARYARDRFAATDRVHVIPNGVDPDRFPAELLERREARGGPFTVGFVGTFKAHHGLDTLVDAFARLRAEEPDARLLLVGDGAERAAIEGRLAGLGLAAAADLTGAVAPADVPARLVAMDVGVAPFPSRRAYVSPLKVYEYLAAGLPVVASGVEQLGGLLGDGDAGVMCAPDDPESLAAALAALARDPERRARMGRTGRRRVLDRHTWDAVAGRILAVAGVGR
jgi:glycosyltransferase involved in cell wall biosynthesis